MTLPEPECVHGYPTTQLDATFRADAMERFGEWMRGQTMMICSEHGTVVYVGDVRRFFG